MRTSEERNIATLSKKRQFLSEALIRFKGRYSEDNLEYLRQKMDRIDALLEDFNKKRGVSNGERMLQSS